MRRSGTAAAVAVVVAIATPSLGHAAALTADMRAEFDAAVDAVDKFWAASYTENFGGTYKSPNVLDPVNGSAGTACGPMSADNAGYCAGGDTIAFGSEFLGRSGELGVLFIYDVVAHEWGHAIQERAKIGFNELGAECFAGAALSGAVRAGTLDIPDGDGAAIAKIAEEMGSSRPATRPSDHGTSEQQLNAYRRGWREGPKSCVDGAQDRPPAAAPVTVPEVPPVDVPPVKVPDVPPGDVPPVTPPDSPASPDDPAPVPSPALPQVSEDAQSGYVPDFGSLGFAS